MELWALRGPVPPLEASLPAWTTEARREVWEEALRDSSPVVLKSAGFEVGGLLCEEKGCDPLEGTPFFGRQTNICLY